MKKILIIEDHADMRELLSWQVELLGFAPVVAKLAREGIDKALAERPDLIILDIMMPGMDGWQFMDQLHLIPGLARTPVVVVTAYGSREGVQSLGATDYLKKPFRLDKLIDLVGKYCPKGPG